MTIVRKSFLLLVLYLTWASPSLAFHGKIVDAPEGDLILVSTDEKVKKIRLYGIAAPARGQPFYEKARALTRFLAIGKSAEITEIYKDSDAVVNALVRIDGIKDYLNQQLIGYGLAWVKVEDCRSRLCEEWRKLEGLAQQNAIGLWSESPAIPPWLWKAAERTQVYEKSMESLKGGN